MKGYELQETVSTKTYENFEKRDLNYTLEYSICGIIACIGYYKGGCSLLCITVNKTMAMVACAMLHIWQWLGMDGWVRETIDY